MYSPVCKLSLINPVYYPHLCSLLSTSFQSDFCRTSDIPSIFLSLKIRTPWWGEGHNFLKVEAKSFPIPPSELRNYSNGFPPPSSARNTSRPFFPSTWSSSVQPPVFITRQHPSGIRPGKPIITVPFRIPASTPALPALNLDWERDPRLMNLSQALHALGWTPPCWALFISFHILLFTAYIIVAHFRHHFSLFLPFRV